jgi:redox-sensitive bicupin YhaK (pirin superfamily)
MLRLYRASDRRQTSASWLTTYHSFPPQGQHDAREPLSGALCFVKEDRVAPGMGFGMRPSHDEEVLTFVLRGTLRHVDSLGNDLLLGPGDVQLVSAGSGIWHSEMNDSIAEPLHLVQIGLASDPADQEPAYQKASCTVAEHPGEWGLIASPDPQHEVLVIRQDALIYRASVQPGQSLACSIHPQRTAWLQVLAGRVALDDTTLAQGDAAAWSGGGTLILTGLDPADLLLLDLRLI